MKIKIYHHADVQGNKINSFDLLSPPPLVSVFLDTLGMVFLGNLKYQIFDLIVVLFFTLRTYLSQGISLGIAPATVRLNWE